MKLEYIVSTDQDGLKLEEFLRKHCSVSRKLLISLKSVENGITKNGVHAKTIDTVNTGDLIELELPTDKTEIEPNPELFVPIVFEDEHIVVFNKPANMPCHPSIKHRTDTLANYFTHLYPDTVFRCINRLDRDTSGLCICAKDAFSANALSKNVEKTYFAAVSGVISDSGKVDAPIAREKESIITRVVREDGDRAVTNFEPICHSKTHTLLKIKLETGRTHQIRVHMSYIGHPLSGDSLYGGDGLLPRQALHCGELEFIHPITRESVRLSCPVPEDILTLFNEGDLYGKDSKL